MLVQFLSGRQRCSPFYPTLCVGAGHRYRLYWLGSTEAEVDKITEERIATVRPVSEDNATGKVSEIFADIKQTKNIDFVPNFWRILATNPDHLELVWANLKTLMYPGAVGRESKLDALTREIIALAVSATNLQTTYYGNHSTFDWLKKRDPVYIAGHSIFLYDLTEDPEGAVQLAGLLRGTGSPGTAASLLLKYGDD